MRLELGQSVRCEDGAFGELADVVIDPTSKRVTHVVAKPKGQDVMTNRLVPVDLIEPAGDGKAITLRCTLEDAAKLESVQEFTYLRLGGFPVGDPEWDVGAEDVLASPFYEGTGFGEYPGDPSGMDAIVYDRVPKGKVEIRRSSPVYSSDGHHLGHVAGRDYPDRRGRQRRQRRGQAEPVARRGRRATRRSRAPLGLAQHPG